MLPKEFDQRRVTVGTLKLGRALFKPSSNGRATDSGPDDQLKVVLQTEVAVLEESIMQCTKADGVRQFPARGGTISPSSHVAGDEQSGIVGIADRALPPLVCERQTPQHVLPDAQPRFTDFDSNKHIGHQQRIAGDRVLNNIVRQILKSQIDGLIRQHVDTSRREEQLSLVPQLLEYTAYSLCRRLAN
jgi:hypothetical protein